MARSNTISKSLTVFQMELLRLIDNEEIQIFTLGDIRSITHFEPEILCEIIENLVQKDFLSRIERGKYCRNIFRDENVIGTFVIADSAVAYWSALNIHGLTEQFANTIFVQSIHKKKPKTIFGTSYQFVQISESKRAGIQYNGYGNYKYPVTDVDKTIADCFDLPQYSGGYAELIRAFDRANLNSEKLISYCTAIGNLSATKRLGFLAEYLQKEELSSFITFALSNVNQSYGLFDPTGNDKGEYNSTWKLKLNITMVEITGIVNDNY